MRIRFHPHALDRLLERGATEDEVRSTVAHGEPFPAKFQRCGFRRNFPFHGEWCGKKYSSKQVEAYCVQEGDDWLVITVITRFF